MLVASWLSPFIQSGIPAHRDGTAHSGVASPSTVKPLRKAPAPQTCPVAGHLGSSKSSQADSDSETSQLVSAVGNVSEQLREICS